MAKSKKHFEGKKQKKHVKMSDKAASFLFCEIITVLLDKYANSEEKDTMSFEEYCAHLRDLSLEKVNKENVKEGENYGEYSE